MSLENKQVFFSPGIDKRLDRLQAILNACRSGAWENVGGIPLIARYLYHLKKIGIKKVAMLLTNQELFSKLKKGQGDLQLQLVTVRENIPVTILSVNNRENHFLYLDTAHLIDPRIIQVLATVIETTLAYIDPRDKKKQAIRAAALTREDVLLWAQKGKDPLIHKARSLFPGDIDPFYPEIRGFLFPYFIEVDSKEDSRRATKRLIHSQQNQVMDLPAQFIDPPFENALTLLLCDTAISPNMVTLLGVAVAMTVAWFFWHGYFVTGALCTFLVEVLDGVDGKLARTKLQYTTFGQHEDIIDYFCETSWYIALAVGLKAAVQDTLPVMLASLLIFSDTLDNLLYTAAKKWYGKNIDLFSPFDAAFRRIAGRRNIYGFMFIIGFTLGYPLKTFAAAAIWAAVTACIHGVRLIQFSRTMSTIHVQPPQRIK
jgi:phosphatidylglycerophosphate synthase